jgi:hypothetical protein
MTAATHREQCSSCACFKPLDILAAGQAGQGQCHRNPPQIVAVMVNTGRGAVLAPVAGFPQIAEKDWCGEYRPRQFEAANA